MKKITILNLLIVLLLFGSSCVDDEPEVSKDLQYVGSWTGTTNQGNAISFTVENSGDVAKVTKHSIKARVSSSSTVEITYISLNAVISNGKFSFSSIDGNELSGSFSSTTKVTGNYKIVISGTPGYSNTSVSGTYTATK